MIYQPDFYGDKKVELVDFLNSEYGTNLSYSCKSNDLVYELSSVFDIKIGKIGTRKSKKLLIMFFTRDDFCGDAFGYCYEIATKNADQEDILRARQILGATEYNFHLGNYLGDAGKEELLVLANSKVFYQSPEWKRARYQALRIYNNFCQCCGRTRSEKIEIHVDHIKPRSLRPDLALDISNLQILCSECNEGKSNIDDTDWR